MYNDFEHHDFSFEHIGEHHLIEDEHDDVVAHKDSTDLFYSIDYEEALRQYYEDIEDWKDKPLLYRIFKFYLKPVKPCLSNFYN